jgi:hypothetical protein
MGNSSETRNPKHEIRNPKQTQREETAKLKTEGQFGFSVLAFAV